MSSSGFLPFILVGRYPIRGAAEKESVEIKNLRPPMSESLYSFLRSIWYILDGLTELQ